MIPVQEGGACKYRTPELWFWVKRKMTTTSKFFLDIVQLEPVSFVLLSDKFWRRRTKFFVAAAAAWPAAAASWWSRRRPRLPGSPSWGQACWCKIGPFQLETEKTVKVIACWRKKNGRRLSRFLNCYQTIWWLVAAPAGPEGHGPPRFWQIS